ncbi:MAG: tRNA (adenosine(37)-N6)-threonylcarbamoyltransferase complex transferase subunit TsaD [Parachlamydiaceae bacterium]
MYVLGIESTCDETAASVVRDGELILSQVVSSQIDLHNIYGGVVPELACRRHMEVIIPVIDKAMGDAKMAIEQIDLIAVSYGPGLVGPLLVGVNAAKGLAIAENKPIVGVNHVEAHLYAALMGLKEKPEFPLLGMVVSGGHTVIVKVNALGSYERIGTTVDDAAGEAFDKVAKLLGLPYPGGPQVEALARNGDPKRFPLKGGRCKNNPYNFSFSGLKTAVMHAVQGAETIDQQFKCDLSASFQRAVLEDLLEKVLKAKEATGCSTLLLGGGVTNNQALRAFFPERAPEIRPIFPTRELSLDNASMIAGLGYHVFKERGPSSIIDLQVSTRIPF